MAAATTTKKTGTAKKTAKASATKSSARSESGERLRKAAQAEIAERLERLEKDEATGDTASGTTKGAGTDSATTSAATDTAPAKPKAKAAKPAKSKRVSALDAAAIVVRTSKDPMRPSEMVVAMKAQGLWSSPTGKTPGATLYAAIIREIAKKGDASRFRKAERGRFTTNARKGA